MINFVWNYTLMQSHSALSYAPDARNWLMKSRHPRILHVFDQVCNLLNERGEVLSIVSPEIGNGPFNIVIEEDIFFPEFLNRESSIAVSPNQLILANLTINTTDAILWNSFPDWEKLYTRRYEIFNQLLSLSLPSYQASIPDSLAFKLSTTLASADISTAKTVTSQLAGLGHGLTPSGDDFIMGAIYATWIIHPFEVATVCAEEIASIAIPLTNSISAAWLRSAGKGEAGNLWHDYFDALISKNMLAIQETQERLLAIGHTSGADALTGFTASIISYAKRGKKLCHS